MGTTMFVKSLCQDMTLSSTVMRRLSGEETTTTYLSVLCRPRLLGVQMVPMILE